MKKSNLILIHSLLELLSNYTTSFVVVEHLRKDLEDLRLQEVEEVGMLFLGRNQDVNLERNI